MKRRRNLRKGVRVYGKREAAEEKKVGFGLYPREKGEEMSRERNIF